MKLSDGKGMYLLVNPTGSKLWRWKYRVLGKEKVMALGAYPDVSLAQARDALDDARKLLAAGSDPMAKRKADKVAAALPPKTPLRQLRGCGGSTGRRPAATARRLRDAALRGRRVPRTLARGPSPRSKPPSWWRWSRRSRRAAPDIAKRALQTSGQVFRYAIAHGMAKRNPAADIKPGDVLAARKKTNLRADGRQGTARAAAPHRRLPGHGSTPGWP